MMARPKRADVAATFRNNLQRLMRAAGASAQEVAAAGIPYSTFKRWESRGMTTPRGGESRENVEKLRAFLQAKLRGRVILKAIDDLWDESLEVVAPKAEPADDRDIEYDRLTADTPLHPSANILMPAMAALAMFERMSEHDWRTVTEEEAEMVKGLLKTMQRRIEQLGDRADACQAWHAWKEWSHAAPTPFRCNNCGEKGLLSYSTEDSTIDISWCESCRSFVCSRCKPAGEGRCRSCRQDEARNPSEADALKVHEIEEVFPLEELATLSAWINKAGRKSTETKGRVGGKGRRVK